MKSPFVQNLDAIWRSLGYASKRNAKRRLTESFTAGIDYVIVPGEKRSKTNRRVAYEKILLTYECFYQLRRLSPSGNELRTQLETSQGRSRQQIRQHLQQINLFVN